MKITLTAWMAAALLASPVLALDAATQVLQPKSLEPTTLPYDSYYSQDPEAAGASASPSDAIPEPAPLHAHAAAPAEAIDCSVQPSCCQPSPCCEPCGHSCCLFGDCCLGEPCSLKGLVDPCDCCAVNFGLWTQIGYHSQQTPLSRNFGDLRAFNDVPDQINLHQQWLWAEKVADGSCGVDWGFRFDIAYGTDAQKTQSFGNDSPVWDASTGFDRGEYGWALPQAYVELAAGDWSVIAGHFFTLVGYEVVTAPDNFFYSRSLTFFNSEPFTHTGVLATYSGLENIELYGGWTLGWDTGFDQALGGSSWLGGFSGAISDDITFTYISTAGNFGLRSQGRDGYSHSLVFDVALSNNLNYVLQSDLVDLDEIGQEQIGINQYLFYNVNDCLAYGARLEWWKADSQSFYEITYGLNYRPHANVVIRPEVRHDWTPSDVGYGDGRDNETTFGIDMVVVY
ncbi:MAG: outer membrane beta-barrel protein [Planctomycetota bacterium]